MDTIVKNPHLQGVIDSLNKSSERAKKLADLSVEELNWKPAPEVWSAGQCIEHLVIAHSLYEDKIDRVINRGWRRHKLEKKPYKQGWIGRWFINKVGPVIKHKIVTPKHFRPPAPVDKTIIGEFLRLQDDIIEMIKKADGLDLNSNRVVSPITFLIRFKLGDGFTVIEVHEQRHLNQAERMLEMQKESKAA